MDQPNVEQTIKEIAAGIFEVDPPAIDGRADLSDDLGATSVTRLEFLVALERRFDVQLDVEEIESARTLPEVVRIVSKYVRMTA